MLPGLFRTLVGLVVAWFVFRFLDRLFGGRRRPSAPRGGGASGRGAGGGAGAGGRRLRRRTVELVPLPVADISSWGSRMDQLSGLVSAGASRIVSSCLAC